MNFCLNHSKLGDDRGVALIVVLWIFIFLFVVAFEFSTAAREEAGAAHRFNEETEGYYLAIAGFERSLYDFLNQKGGAPTQPQEPKSDFFDGLWREQSLGTGGYRTRFIDESGKININRVSDETLRRVFTNLGIDPARRDVLVDSIMDWRDADDLHRVNGAETDYYASLAPGYSAKNGPLDSVADLLWIKGMTRELYFGASESTGAPPAQRSIGLSHIFTVDSPIDRVNLRTASAEVIYALIGIPLERCVAFVEERKKLSEKTLGDLLPLLGIGAGDAALQTFIFTNPSIVAVEAEGKPKESRVPRRVKGIVRLGGAQGFELLRWLDRDAALPPD